MKSKINSFRGEYFFLSNFYEAPVTYEGITYQNNEAAFQAQKVNSPTELYFVDPRLPFANLGPSEARKKGKHVPLRKDWEQVKYGIMKAIVYAKFSQNEDLKEKLLETGDAYLEEGNTWGDKTWGTVGGEGKNLLGQILMDIRDALYCEKQTDELKNRFYER